MHESDSIVIIPTYNEKENIEKIIRAVFGLDKCFHILVIDDGSPDGTAQIVKRLMADEFGDRLFIVERSGKRAVTRWKLIAHDSNTGLSLVRCDIETGRTHQIRVHLASIGTPVAGDAVYGRPRLDKRLAAPPQRQLLHAWRLSFRHPVTRAPLVFEAPVPQDFLDFFPSPPPLK